MPFIDTCDSELTPEFYNIIHAVGKNCPNQHDDVKCVQIMLQMFYMSAGLTAPKGQMVADGICGPITKNWILKFQLDMRANGVMLTADQRIDRVRNNQSVGVISHTKYGLLALNEGTASVNPVGWSSIPSMVMMADAATVPPPSSDYVPENVGSQSTSPGGGFGRTPT